MGRVKNSRNSTGTKKGGLRRRWLINTFGIMCALGLVCVLIVTAVFSAYYFNNFEADLKHRTESVADSISAIQPEDKESFWHLAGVYVQEYEVQEDDLLQILGTDGTVKNSSRNTQEACITTADITEALQTGETAVYTGKDSQLGRRAMAASVPLKYNGETVGILRLVSPVAEVISRIARVGLISMLALVAVMLIVLLSSNYYFRSILIPLRAIVEKAKKITSGSYGIQIETAYDDEIGELADTINEMSIKINENEKMQTEFISSLSHELRTPLTAITGWSETLLSGEDLDPQTRRGMKIIHKEAGRLTEMVLDLLDFTRIQDGRMTLNIELADIRSEYEDVVYMYGSRLSQDDMVLDYQDNDDEIPEISCDPKRMRQVFLNILDNAAKHGSEGNRIETSIALENGSVVVRIRDYGPGIPEDELPLVKKKFYKGSSKARGSGIGLAVCDEIVQMHGGELILENAPGGGTLVTVVLPVSQ